MASQRSQQMTAGRLRHVVALQAPFGSFPNRVTAAQVQQATIPSGEVVPPWVTVVNELRAEVKITGASKEIIADQSVMLITGTLTHRFYPRLKGNMQYLWTDYQGEYGEPTVYTLNIAGITWDTLKIWHTVAFKQRSW